jgi:hypothetical protein
VLGLEHPVSIVVQDCGVEVVEDEQRFHALRANRSVVPRPNHVAGAIIFDQLLALSPFSAVPVGDHDVAVLKVEFSRSRDRRRHVQLQ